MLGLQKFIQTGGVTALLFDPGTGKTAVVIDYACLLALKSETREARVLVVAPLAAVDTWVLQTQKFVSPQVSYWVEVVGGSMLEKAEALASRGGNPHKRGLIKMVNRISPIRKHGPRGLHWEKADFWAGWAPRTRSGGCFCRGMENTHERGSEGCTGPQRRPPISPSEGPDGLGDDLPRVIIEVINIDPLQRRDEMGSRTMADTFVEAIRRFDPDLVVVDEAHKIKSASGNASRLMARVARIVRRRALLTGTVMPHSPLDVFAEWRFLQPNAFGQKDENGVVKLATLADFNDRFARMGGFYGKEVKGYTNLGEMQEIMARNAVVARKEECLDLPATTDVIVPVTLSAAEAGAYEDIRKKMAADLASGLTTTVTSVLTQGMRLRQITSGYLPTDDHGPIEVLGRSKVDVIKSIVEDQLPDEKRIVIFCLFSFEIAMLKKVLSRDGRATNQEIMVIEGGTPTDDRQRMRQRFGSDEPQRMVMIAQIKTMSVAVNELVTANHAVFGSLSQQRDDLIQAKARLDRVGQTRPVTFWFPLALGTVDEVILDSHEKRTNLEAAMLHHIQHGGFTDQGLLVGVGGGGGDRA